MKRMPVMVGLLVVLGFLLLAAGTGAVLASGHHGPAGKGWVDAGKLADLNAWGVLKVPNQDVFLVADGLTPLALSSVDPHLQTSIKYCANSGWFEDVYGEEFDGHGFYRQGPSPRGMDRVTSTVFQGDVWIKPSDIIVGPSRDATSDAPSQEPEGPFCE